jgi:hypothetical protein
LALSGSGCSFEEAGADAEAFLHGFAQGPSYSGSQASGQMYDLQQRQDCLERNQMSMNGQIGNQVQPCN